MGIYFLIGIVFILINGLIRKIDTDGDWTIVFFVWFLLWPLSLLSIIFTISEELIYIRKYKIKKK